MKIAILDDYQDTVKTLDCFPRVAGHEVTIWKDHTEDVEVLAERLAETEALLLIRERTPITEQLLGRLPKLKLISQFGSVPHIDLAACERRGVVVCSQTIPGQPSYATAELTWGLILAATRRIPQEVAALKLGRWQSPSSVGRTLRGQVLGIYGYGRIGGVVANYGRAFGMDVLVWGRESTIAKARADGWDTATDADDFFGRSDVISLHLPMRPETKGIVTAKLLAKMKPTALIVNTSRAGLIEPGALEHALRQGRPGLAAVDVFEQEPVTAKDNPLIQMPNVVATPHIGYVERGTLEAMFEIIFEQVIAYAAGKSVNVVVPASR